MSEDPGAVLITGCSSGIGHETASRLAAKGWTVYATAREPERIADLVACAGLEPPLGGGIFDISCASCQGGSRSAPGPDNGPCPQPGGVCFLHDCEAILQMNGY